jgi:hypothetical protein
MEIRNLVSELLTGHDCVIIPGFGGFIGSYVPARIDPVSHTFQPPSKKLMFNVSLSHNDGLLSSAVAQTLGIPSSEASLRIEDFVSEIIQELQSGGSVVFNRVGRLFPGPEGTIQFEQSRTSNLHPESFGLVTFIAPPVQRNQTLFESGKKRTAKTESIHSAFFPDWFKKVAALLILAGIAGVFGFFQYDKITGLGADKAGILSEIISKFSASSLERSINNGTADHNTQADIRDSILVVKDSLQTEPLKLLQTLVAEQVETGEEKSNGSHTYAVIIGAFRQQENAGKLVDELSGQGIDAMVYDRTRGGLYRVAMATFDNRAEAVQMLASAQNGDYPQAWLLVK